MHAHEVCSERTCRSCHGVLPRQVDSYFFKCGILMKEKRMSLLPYEGQGSQKTPYLP